MSSLIFNTVNAVLDKEIESAIRKLVATKNVDMLEKLANYLRSKIAFTFFKTQSPLFTEESSDRFENLLSHIGSAETLYPEEARKLIKLIVRRSVPREFGPSWNERQLFQCYYNYYREIYELLVRELEKNSINIYGCSTPNIKAIPTKLVPVIERE